MISLDFHYKARLVGIEQFVKYLEDSSPRCSSSVPVDSAYFCNSPHRLDIAKRSIRTEQEKDMNRKVLALVK